MNLHVENNVAKICAVREEDRDAQQETEEVDVIVTSHTVVYPDTMMVRLLYAGATDAAMLTSCWLRQVTSPAGGIEVSGRRLKDRVVEWVACHGRGVVGWADAGLDSATQVEKSIWRNNHRGKDEVVQVSHPSGMWKGGGY